ncbi:MAG: conjugal transfer protein TrbI [Thiohalocapsa sp.]|nr:conjugal transfer protein TrbI [Thiohalocapsa sp.]
MTGLTSTWDSLSPRARQWLTLGAGGLVVAALALLIATAPDERERTAEERKRMVSNLLTDVDPRNLGIDGLGRRMKTLEGEVRKIAYSLEQLGLDDADNDGARAQLLQTLRREREAELEALQRELARLRDALDSRAQDPVSSVPGTFTPPAPSDPATGALDATTPGPSSLQPSVPRPEPPPLDRLFDPPPTARPQPANRPANQPAAAKSSPSIRHLKDDAAASQPTPAEQAAAAIPEVRIPAGSILQGVFLSGMDAPTGRAARQDPYPALLRLKHDAILPNRFRADIRECFLLVGGYGDLGSERVYLRAESINCVRRDGRTIEVAIDGYAVGEDGKVGVRGRLVNKQGQVIGRAMQVSFLQGFSRLFSTVPVTTVASGGGAVPYQQVFSTESLQGAAIAGTGKALDRLAEYYLDLAECLVPDNSWPRRSYALFLARGVMEALAAGADAGSP